MSDMSVWFGTACPRCGTTVGVQVGGGSTCPDCGAKMVPAEQPNAPESLTNYLCPNCRSYFGHLLSPGPIDKCPDCGHPIQR